MKKCPYCAEEIQDGAIKCKHCGEFLRKVESLPKNDQRTVTIKKAAKIGIKKQSGFHYLVDKQGDISAFVEEAKRAKKVARVGIKREVGYFYFIDKQGDISYIEESLIPYASQEIKDYYEFTRVEAEHKNAQAIQQNSIKSTQDDDVGVPKCPTCRSKEVEKISAGAKLSTMFLWGRLDNLIKTFKCNKCGHRW